MKRIALMFGLVSGAIGATAYPGPALKGLGGHTGYHSVGSWIASVLPAQINTGGWHVLPMADGLSSSIRALRMHEVPIDGTGIAWTALTSPGWNLGSNGFTAFGGSIRFTGDDPWLIYSLGVNHSGTVKARFAWDGGTYGLPSPTRLYTRISSRADGKAYGGSASASNGLGNAAVNKKGALISEGSKVVKVEPNGLGLFESEAISLSASASCPSNFGGPEASADVRFDVLAPAYIKWSWDLDPTYFKGSNGIKTANARTPDWGMKVDTSVTWSEMHQRWLADADLEVVQSAYEHPNYFWTASGSTSFFNHCLEPGGWGRLAPFTLEFGTQSATGALGKDTTIGVDVVNMDSNLDVAMDNIYKIQWHYPYENWFERKPADFDTVLIPVTVPSAEKFAHNNGVVLCEWDKPAVVWGLSKAALDLSGILLKHPVWGGIKSVLGLALSELTPEPQSGMASFDACWVENGYSCWFYPAEFIGYYVPPSPPASETLEQFQDRFKMYPKKFVNYANYYLRGDSYDEAGYVGVTDRCIRKVHGMFWAGDFKLFNYGANGGGGGGPILPGGG